MEPKYKYYDEKWYDIETSCDDTRNIAKIYSDMMRDESVNKTITEKLHNAVTEQVVWARTMLKYKSHRKSLSDKEIKVLKDISNNSTYYESDREILNTILEKYKER